MFNILATSELDMLSFYWMVAFGFMLCIIFIGKFFPAVGIYVSLALPILTFILLYNGMFKFLGDVGMIWLLYLTIILMVCGVFYSYIMCRIDNFIKSSEGDDEKGKLKYN